MNHTGGTHGALGHASYLPTGTWEDSYASPPWGASDCPSVDESILAGWGFCNSWAYGQFLDGSQHAIGRMHVSGTPFRCTPRGPGAFARFDEVGDGRAAHLTATRLRTDACRKIGQPAILYIGGGSETAYTPTSPRSVKAAVLKSWTDPIVAAGYTHVAVDGSAVTQQLPGETTPTYDWAEHLLSLGIGFIVETLEWVCPTSVLWFNGRFGCISSDHDRMIRGGNSWFHRGWTGCTTRRYLWIQGSVPPADRVALTAKELEDANGDQVIVDPGQCWTELKAMTATPTASVPTSALIQSDPGSPSSRTA